MSSLLAVKLRRDLAATWSRVLMMVVAIAVCLTVFGGVLYAWAVSSRETGNAYVGTEPASATILLDNSIDATEMAALAAQVATRPDILAATGRTQFTSEKLAVNGEMRDVPLQVFAAAPDDPMRMAKFRVEDGVWPPPPGSIYIGRDSLALLDTAVADTVMAMLPSGERVTLRVAGTVYDPSLAPAPQHQTGHAFMATNGTGPQPLRLDQLKFQVADPGGQTPTRDRDTVVAAAGAISRWLQTERGISVREVQVPEPYAHPHQGQTNALLESLLAGGTAALVLSTILVANMLNTLLSQQVPQIGIMKAIGARTGRIGRHYLTMIMLIAIAATALAIGPAVLIGRMLDQIIFGFIGIEPATLAAPAWVYLVTIAAGLLLAPVMALIPLVRASRITVREAINHHGGASGPRTASGWLARLSRIPRLDRGLLLALRNTVRRPTRFVLAAGLMAGACTVFVAGISLSAGVDAVGQIAKQERIWDVDVKLDQPAAMSAVQSALASVSGIDRAEGLAVSKAGLAGPGQVPVTRTYPDQGHGGVSVTAIPADTTTFRPPSKFLAGRWLNPGETGAIVLNQITRNKSLPDVGIDDDVQLTVNGKATTWRVVGLVEEREGGAGGLYVTAEGFAAAMAQAPMVNQLRIVTGAHDEQTRSTIATAAATALRGAGLSVESADSVSVRDTVSSGHLGPIIMVVVAVAISLGILGIIGLASTMSANVLERTREFAVMHAIGARRAVVRRIVVAEGLGLAVASLILAVLPTLGLTALLGAGLGNLFMEAPLPFRVSLAAVGIWTILVILGAILATEAAASRASRITVREALAYL
ncbi:FtsX-like permease family protein [Nocardia nepalensis]|uniref:FtsX-like permease family protein n=1 Tax=Nocardia nepalensis TaxID=3375448 RepID=UPI003B677CAA